MRSPLRYASSSTASKCSRSAPAAPSAPPRLRPAPRPRPASSPHPPRRPPPLAPPPPRAGHQHRAGLVHVRRRLPDDLSQQAVALRRLDVEPDDREGTERCQLLAKIALQVAEAKGNCARRPIEVEQHHP